jgi:hypothetical protein
MAQCDVSREALYFGPREDVADQSQSAMSTENLSVTADNSSALLTPVLESMQADTGQSGSLWGSVDPEDPALIVKVIR